MLGDFHFTSFLLNVLPLFLSRLTLTVRLLLSLLITLSIVHRSLCRRVESRPLGRLVAFPFPFPFPFPLPSPLPSRTRFFYLLSSLFSLLRCVSLRARVRARVCVATRHVLSRNYYSDNSDIDNSDSGNSDSGKLG